MLFKLHNLQRLNLLLLVSLLFGSLLFQSFGQEIVETVIDEEEKIPSLAEAPVSDLPFRITSDEFLDYDEEMDFIYGRARTRIWYKDVYLEADRLIYDVRLNEVQAFGDILLQTDGDEYHAEKLWYDLDTGRGYAFDAGGRRDNIFIHGDPEETDVPSFELLDQDEERRPREAIFRNTSFTTCDFPVPHYRVRAREILLYPNDRVYFRHVTLYIREFPVLYLPAYTRSLDESFPWSFMVGYSSDLGAYLRIAYDFQHAEYEPSIRDEEDMVEKSRGHMSIFGDYFTKRGFGLGAKYKYHFDFLKHKGEMDLYAINDKRFDPMDYSSPFRIEESNDYTRWIANLKHRSQLTDEIYLQLNIDEMSDPDLYFDILDNFNDQDRSRVPERDMRAAITYRDDNIIGRMLLQRTHRIGRDRVTNYASPWDDDAAYDLDPYRREEEDDDEGFSRERYGLVSQRLPQLSFTTNYLKLGGMPLYTYTDLNIINNLDRGLNVVDKDDDSWVRGLDLYQALLYRWKFSPRYTLTARLGVGASYMMREEDEFGYDFPPGTVFPYDMPEYMGGYTFLDDETFIIGRRHYDEFGNLITTPDQLASWRKRSIDEVEDYYVYADLMLYFYARFTDYLHGWIRYDLREGTDDSLGEFYESVGNTLARQDLYRFRLPEHWLRIGLDYFLAYPNLNAFLSGGYNLQGNDDIYSKEELYYIATGLSYLSPQETFRLNTSLRYSGRQELDPSDPQEGSVDMIYGVINAQYMPVSELWWTRMSVSGHKTLNDRDEGRDRGFDEYDTEMNVTGLVGGKIGPKYVVEGSATWKERLAGSGISNVGMLVKRDLHDFIASLFLGLERDVTENEFDDDDEREGEWEIDARFTLEFKSPYQQASLGTAPIKTLAELAKEAEVAEDEFSAPMFTNR